MHLALGTDIFDSFQRYQRRLIDEYNALASEFDFVTVDARRPIETIQEELRAHIGAYLAGGRPSGTARGTPAVPLRARRGR